MTITVGAIADDFTGALDLANNFVRAGLRTVHLNGVRPETAAPPDADAVVIALKTRTAPCSDAVAETRAALDWLRRQSAQKYYVKYCSTFDSTPAGNIGPAIDAVMDDLGAALTVAVPAFPAAGRTVYRGNLFVGDVPLNESGMCNHPLTPMTDANVVRLLSPQTRRPVHLITNEVISAGADAVRRRLGQLAKSGGGIVVIDTIGDDQLQVIASATADLAVVTGGSGLATALPKAWGLSNGAADALPTPDGARAVIAGSVSQATNEQVNRYRGPKFRIDPHRLMRGADLVGQAVGWAEPMIMSGKAPLIYSTAAPEVVAQAQACSGADVIGQAIEDSLAKIARRLTEAGVRQLIVAGGETSGACMRALDIHELRVGQQIDPGVPWAYGNSFVGGLHIALKSGNFGRPDFFTAAFELLNAGL